MQTKDISSSQNLFKKLFFLRKKMIAVFVFAVMSVNGFAPSTMELGKFSFVLVLASVTHNAAVTVLSKCRDSLTIMSNSLSGNICGLFKLKTTANPGQEKKEKDGKRNTTGDYAVVQLQKELTKKRISQGYKFSIYAAGDSITYSFANEYLFSEKKAPGGGFFVFLIFLVFIYAVRQRKGLSESFIMRNGRKIKISA